MGALGTDRAGFRGSRLTASLLADRVSLPGVDCFNDDYARVRMPTLTRATARQA